MEWTDEQYDLYNKIVGIMSGYTHFAYVSEVCGTIREEKVVYQDEVPMIVEDIVDLIREENGKDED